jgi:hypothetical protein
VKKHVNIYGEPDNIEILQTFGDGEAARSYEQQILTAASAAQDPQCLNRHNGGKKFFNREGSKKGRKCKPHTAATKEKLRIAATGKTLSAATKEKIRQAKLGRKCKPRSAAHKEKLRQANLGKPMSAAATAATVAGKIARREKKIKNGTASKFQIKQHLKYLAALSEKITHFPPDQIDQIE